MESFVVQIQHKGHCTQNVNIRNYIRAKQRHFVQYDITMS